MRYVIIAFIHFSDYDFTFRIYFLRQLPVFSVYKDTEIPACHRLYLKALLPYTSLMLLQKNKTKNISDDAALQI